MAGGAFSVKAAPTYQMLWSCMAAVEGPRSLHRVLQSALRLGR